MINLENTRVLSISNYAIVNVISNMDTNRFVNSLLKTKDITLLQNIKKIFLI